MSVKKGYVFVCCGSREHTDTLSVALKYLKPRTNVDIFIVTDNDRNEDKLIGDGIIDVKTPIHFSHHQASIYLKTSLHRILPHGAIYAYLDTDILAIDEFPDAIFDEYIPPIRFAADHCKMKQFSPYAVNCGCLSENENIRTRVNKLIREVDPISGIQSEYLQSQRKKLESIFQGIKKRKIPNIWLVFKYLTSIRKFYITPEFYFDRQKKIWYNKAGEAIMYHVDMKKIAQKEGLKWSFIKNEIEKLDGSSIWEDNCSHLASFAERKFHIKISDSNWQHWNGGVFLFSDESRAFMDTWHAFTLDIFEDKNWKTRDQGTLIATAWKLGVENQQVLSDRWNYIADYNNRLLNFKPSNLSITKDGVVYTHPSFIHIYHHFGDENWPFWRFIMESFRH